MSEIRIRYLEISRQREIIGRSCNYLHVLPHPALRKYLAHYTLSVPAAKRVPETVSIVPDASGCIVCTFDGCTLATEFWGPTSRMVTVPNDVNSIPLRVFIEFHPCGAHYLLRRPLVDLHNAFLPLEQVDRALDRAVQRDFEASFPDVPSFLNRLDALFLTCLGHGVSFDPVQATVRCIADAHGAVRIDALSDQNACSARYLNRAFTQRLGMSVKRFARLVRINTACALIKGGVSGGLTMLAQDLEYYDQAHFIHDFKDICGLVPSLYLKNKSDFYNEEFKLNANTDGCALIQR